MRLVVVKDGKYMKMIDVCLLKTTDIEKVGTKHDMQVSIHYICFYLAVFENV